LPTTGVRQNSVLQNCAAAIGTGSLDSASPFCRAWLVAMFRNRSEDVQRLMELAMPDGMQEMKVRQAY